MKRITSIILVFVWYFNFPTVLSAHVRHVSQETTPLKYLTKFVGDQPTMHHRVVKRQTNDEIMPSPEDTAICNAELKDASCTVGIEQGFAEVNLRCNLSSIEQAQKVANACARDENGQFCGSLWDRYRLRANYIEGNCSRVLTTNSCPSNCRSLLEDFRSTHSCCINAYVNGTGLYSGATSLNYRVWNLCNVPLPPAACGNGPTINPPGNVQSCTNEEVLNKYYVENVCLPERRQAYIDVLIRLGTNICGDTIYTPSYIEDACSADTNGVSCGTLFLQFLEDSIMIDGLNSACITSNVSCTSNCRDGIIAAKNRNGCCLRSIWFNLIIVPALSPSVLRSCDIELPGTCEGLIYGSAVSIMKEKYILPIAAGIIMCLLQFMMAA
jgi:hypothetical protein